MGVYTESARQLINPMDIPTFMIECAKTERALFEGVIELDFAEVYKENGLAVFTEEETAAADTASNNATEQATENIFKKFGEALKKAFEAITNKLKDFFEKTASLVNSKVINDPKAASCTTKDIWFKKYKEATDKLNVLSDYQKAADKAKALMEKAWSGDLDDSSFDEYKDFCKELIDTAVKFIEIPTTVEEYNNSTSDLKNQVEPVELGSMKNEFGELQKALSVGGIGSNLKDIFSKLSSKEKLFEAKPDETTEQKNARRTCAATFCTIKLQLFQNECKIVSNTCKIARRNYSEIAAAVKGSNAKADETTVQNNSAVYAALSDMLCESVFGI